jgi:tetratricopeptide (TPR) repeat protein
VRVPLLVLVSVLLPSLASPVRAAPAAEPPASTPPAGELAPAVPTAAQHARARSLFAEGKKRFALQQFREALRLFTQAYELVPLSGFLFNIGQCHRFLGDCRQAIFFYGGFVRENPGTPDAVIVQGLLDGCQRRLAVEQAEQARAGRSFDEGKRALDLGDWGAAVVHLKTAYRAQPRPGYLYHLGVAHQGLKQWAEAIRLYGAYLQANPESPQSEGVRGRLAECQKQLDAERIRQGLSLDRPDGQGRKKVPAHKKWWVWTLAVVGAAAVAVGLGVGLTQGRDSGTNYPPYELRVDMSKSGK